MDAHRTVRLPWLSRRSAGQPLSARVHEEQFEVRTLWSCDGQREEEDDMMPAQPGLPGQVVIYRNGEPQYFDVPAIRTSSMPMYPAKDWRDGAAQPTQMRRFYFERNNDVSGTSGTGMVAEGVQFSDGRVALRWITNAGMPSSTVVYDSIGDAETIHGHGGGTKVVWVDGG